MMMALKQNVGMRDRWFRICAGIILVVLGSIVVKGTIGIILLILGIPSFMSGIFGVCPTYSLLGITTRRHHDSC